MAISEELVKAAQAEQATFRRLSELTDPVVLFMLEYWTRKKGERAMPHPRDMDPVDFARHLPHILMVEICHEPFDLTYRLMGERIVSAYGGKGRDLPVLTPPRSSDGKPHRFGELMFAFYKWIAHERRPIGAGGSFDFLDERVSCFEAVNLPLSCDGERVDRILGVIHHFAPPSPKSA